MYRKARRRADSGTLNLDSLMDILSCLVGVMLFMVIYTVLELSATAFEVQMPVARAEPAGSRQVVVFCTGGTVRVLDARTSLGTLLTGLPLVSFSEAPGFVRRANERPLADQYFNYSLSYQDRVDAMGARSRTIALQIDELPGVVGDSIHQLGEGSRFATLLDDLSPENTWMEFIIDGSSLDIFRQARLMASDAGFATGWNPMGGGFPVRSPLSVGGRLRLGPEAVLTKPLR